MRLVPPPFTRKTSWLQHTPLKARGQLKLIDDEMVDGANNL